MENQGLDAQYRELARGFYDNEPPEHYFGMEVWDGDDEDQKEEEVITDDKN